ncbi:hypothetical protein V5F79_22235 [Xanthobacter flavus]|uniref:hypothetical protein n=1 Tax=Xanthobacter flavus TaxID=281 RepID=UPI00372BEC64
MLKAAFWGFGGVITALNAYRVGVILWPLDLGLSVAASSAMACMAMLFMKDAVDSFRGRQRSE